MSQMGLQTGDLDLQGHQLALKLKYFVRFLLNARTLQLFRILASNLNCLLII